MRLEDTSGALRELGVTLFSLVEELSGERPGLLSNTGWYRVQVAGVAFLYRRLVGEPARKFPANSVHLSTKWDERLASEGVMGGNNWYGSGPSADRLVKSTNPAEIGPAEEFIRHAFRLYGKRARS